MIKGTLIDRATGKVFGRVEAKDEVQLAAYSSDTVEVISGWDRPVEGLNREAVLSAQVKATRNQILDNVSWTIRADSPLSPANQAEWLIYMQALQRLTLDYPDPATVVWPEEPALEYA